MTSSLELISKGKEAYAAENYENALQFFTDAVSIDQQNSGAYAQRAFVNVKLEKYGDARADSEKAIELNEESAEVLFNLGVACYWLKDFSAAKDAFRKGREKNSSDDLFGIWIERCENEMSNGKSEVLAASHPPIKKDWYQTESHVAVTLMLKGLREKDLKINISSDSLDIEAKCPNGTERKLNVNLAHSIVPERSSWKLLSTKIEIWLRKQDGIQWKYLERGSSSSPGKVNKSDKVEKWVPTYPSSAAKKKDWDKIASDIQKQETDEKLEGDAALNQLFQQIYKDGGDDVRRAMNKSFMESGGTVLSTNWKEVGDKEVIVKPPDGMEFKKWDQ